MFLAPVFAKMRAGQRAKFNFQRAKSARQCAKPACRCALRCAQFLSEMLCPTSTFHQKKEICGPSTEAPDAWAVVNSQPSSLTVPRCSDHLWQRHRSKQNFVIVSNFAPAGRTDDAVFGTLQYVLGKHTLYGDATSPLPLATPGHPLFSG